MEINLRQLNDQMVESTTASKEMRLSKNASSMVFQLFTKNVYSNPIGTVVREIASNCFDSHVEAKVNSPVLIKKIFDKQTNTTFISFIDFGVGMSPDRVDNIYGVYFESSKRVDNTQIGGFGIGGKTPLAYKRATGVGEGEYDNSFYVITVFDKMKYYYCVFEGQESPCINLLHSEATTEGNGTEVRIPVLEKDLEKFEKEMVRQLYYFENVIFEGFGFDKDGEKVYRNTAEILTNKYQIVRGQSFLYRGKEYSDNMHVCLGRVAYPIDYNVLGLSSSDYRMPIALRLEVGDINVTVSRESLDYSEATIKKLRSKLAEAKEELKSLLSKQYESIVSLEDYFKVKNAFGQLFFSNGTSINLGNIIQQKDVDFSNFKYNDLKLPSSANLFKFFFNVKTYGKKTRSRWNSSGFEGSYEGLLNKNNLMYFTGEFQRKLVKQAYLKDTLGTYYMISLKELNPKLVEEDVYELFKINLTQAIQILDGEVGIDYFDTLLEMQQEFFEIVQRHAKDYTTLVVPEDYVQQRKDKGLTKQMREQSISLHFVGSRSRYRVKLDKLFNYKEPIFYGSVEEENELRQGLRMFNGLFNSDIVINYYSYRDIFENRVSGNHIKSKNGTMVKDQRSIMFIMLSETNLKYMKFCKNANHISTLKHKLLYRKEDMIVQYFQNNGIINKYDELESLYKADYFTKIDMKTGKKINELKRYFAALPDSNRQNRIDAISDDLAKYFNISEIALTEKQLKISKKIDDLVKIQEQNSKTLSYLRVPSYSYSTPDAELLEIMKKVMVF